MLLSFNKFNFNFVYNYSIITIKLIFIKVFADYYFNKSKLFSFWGKTSFLIKK